MKNRLSYLILFFLIAVIVLVLLLILKKDNDTINLWASGNMNNSGCLSIYVDDQNNNEYSFDNGKTWQSSKYGAIYDKNIILVRDKEKKYYLSKRIELSI